MIRALHTFYRAIGVVAHWNSQMENWKTREHNHGKAYYEFWISSLHIHQPQSPVTQWFR